jgi:predicted O-methyltransferase YrrM
MSEYTLTKSITSYKYPAHMKRPEGFFGSNFFEKWIPDWQTQLAHLAGKPDVVGIEIGVLNGDCSVFLADQIVNGEGSILYAVDINCTDEFKNNVAPFQNHVDFRRGYSFDVLRNLTHKGQTKQFADFIYIDGSHLAIDVMQDAVLSWHLLKDNGILIFDDYGWGAHTPDEKQKPKLAIDAFLNAYQGHLQVIHGGWQVFIKKLPYVYSAEELEANYQK